LLLHRELDFKWGEAHFCATFAALAAQQREFAQAARLATAGLTLTQGIGMLAIPLSQAIAKDALDRARTALSAKGFARAQEQGAGMSFDQAITEALAVAREGTAAVASLTEPSQGAVQAADEAPVADAPLSPREVEVLRLLAVGRTTREIADALVIAVPTVDRHITHIYAKIGSRGRAAAAAYAIRHGLT
jgi:DNA-binding NarL/FixJ family response regulator